MSRFELTGENAQRLAALELSRESAGRLPDGERVYLCDPALPADDLAGLRLLHPLVLYDAEAEDVLFLNARRGRDAMTKTIGTSALGELAQGLAAVAARLPPEAAPTHCAHAAKLLSESITETDSFRVDSLVASAAPGFAAVAARLPPDQAAKLLRETMTKTTGYSALRELTQGLATVAAPAHECGCYRLRSRDGENRPGVSGSLGWQR